MKLSVGILTWQNISTIEMILNVLKVELADIDHEIIIVDQGSDDGTEEYATIANWENKGISVGKNQCINAAKGEYVLLLDGDVVPVKDSVKCLIEWMDTHQECNAIGFYPNKFSVEPNKEMTWHHEEVCHELFDVKESPTTCLFYGLFRRKIFDDGLRMDESGPFGEVGYGWEDHDFYMQMKERGITQYVAHINHAGGKYYHAINSSIRAMGREKYMETSRKRNKYFKEKWICSTK